MKEALVKTLFLFLMVVGFVVQFHATPVFAATEQPVAQPFNRALTPPPSILIQQSTSSSGGFLSGILGKTTILFTILAILFILFIGYKVLKFLGKKMGMQ